jgi:predicted porin
MKKSLVALAALTLVGAASAQVTITGTLSAGYQGSLDRTRGFTVSDNSVFFGVNEDLGGGNKLFASTGLDVGGRATAGGATAGQENFALGVSGGFGKVTLSSFESDGPFAAIDGLSGASLPVGVFDAVSITGGKRFRNGLLYSSPAFSGFTIGASYVTLAGDYTPENTLDAKTKVTPSLTYAAGPLKAYVEYSLFNASYNATGAASSPADPVTQPTAYVTYDFGVAKVGAAWSKPSNGDVSWGLGVNAPIGALTLGLATFSANNSAASGSATYTEASAAYALSKRTSIKTSFGQVNDSFNTIANANASNATYGLAGGTFGTNTQTRVGLYHSF